MLILSSSHQISRNLGWAMTCQESPCTFDHCGRWLGRHVGVFWRATPIAGRFISWKIPSINRWWLGVRLWLRQTSISGEAFYHDLPSWLLHFFEGSRGSRPHIGKLHTPWLCNFLPGMRWEVAFCTVPFPPVVSCGFPLNQPISSTIHHHFLWIPPFPWKLPWNMNSSNSVPTLSQPFPSRCKHFQRKTAAKNPENPYHRIGWWESWNRKHQSIWCWKTMVSA